MIEVQVGAEHVVDVLRSRAGATQPGEIRGVQLAECRQFLAFVNLVVADAGVHQDPVVGRADQPAMEAEHDQTLVGLKLLRRENLAVFFHQLHWHVRNEVGVARVREHQLLDAMNLVGAKFEHSHTNVYQ